MMTLLLLPSCRLLTKKARGVVMNREFAHHPALKMNLGAASLTKKRLTQTNQTEFPLGDFSPHAWDERWRRPHHWLLGGLAAPSARIFSRSIAVGPDVARVTRSTNSGSMRLAVDFRDKRGTPEITALVHAQHAALMLSINHNGVIPKGAASLQQRKVSLLKLAAGSASTGVWASGNEKLVRGSCCYHDSRNKTESDKVGLRRRPRRQELLSLRRELELEQQSFLLLLRLLLCLPLLRSRCNGVATAIEAAFAVTLRPDLMQDLRIYYNIHRSCFNHSFVC